MGGLVIVALIVVAAIVIGVTRGKQVGNLARDGVEVTGTVDSKFRTGAGHAGSLGRRIRYSYTGPDGQLYLRTATVPIGVWAELEEGGPITVVYLPADPGVSAPAWLVRSAREALDG